MKASVEGCSRRPCDCGAVLRTRLSFTEDRRQAQKALVESPKRPDKKPAETAYK